MAAQETVEGTLEAYRSAVQAKDVDAFVSLYDEDARTFDMWGLWSYEGATALRKLADEWFRSVGDDRIEVQFDEVHTTVGDDTAVLHAFVTFAGVSPSGERLRAMTNRFTWGLRRTDGSWKVVHEHTSAPLDFETSKVILERGR